jgi:hypothetical protein
MKECKQCGQLKDQSQFSKCSRAKSGLQPKCKQCNKTDNYKFRTEINPSHHAEWQRNNFSRVVELVKKYRKADKSSLIYSIRNPEGDTYIGMTQMYFKVRKWEHRTNYKKHRAGMPSAGNIPLLYESFDKWGINNHQFEVVVDMGDIDREQLKFIETSFIQAFQQVGKSLNIKQ